jgi:hypothetical protein
VEHLDQRFELLSAGARTALPRHRTLRSAIDWSYNLLDSDERALLDRLGVFPADFDYEAVQSVCRAADLHGRNAKLRVTVTLAGLGPVAGLYLHPDHRRRPRQHDPFGGQSV